MRTNRGGFTLIELLVVAVLGALLVVASYKVLIINQRTYTVQNARIAGQQISRAALDVLTAELREINPSDLVSIGDEQVTFRAQRSFGLACAVTLGNPPAVTTVRVGDWFEVGDSIVVYADNQAGSSADDEWIVAQVSSSDTTQVCNAQEANRLAFAGQQAAFLADTVLEGAPVRSFVHYTYGRFDMAGGSYIARQIQGGSVEPLVGPVPASFATGVPTLEFVYMDGTGSVTATPASVRQIEVRVRVRSDATNAQGEMIADSLMTRVYLRN